MANDPSRPRGSDPAGDDPSADEMPKKTLTLPEDQRGPWFEGPDVVTMLRVYGTALAFELPREVKTFTLGSSPDRDIAIPTEHLSSLHCVVERRGPKLRVYDQHSKNGTYHDGTREAVFDLRPGRTFMASSIRFLAMNDEMRDAYARLVDLLGPEDEHVLRAPDVAWTSPSDVIVAATGEDHLLITGEPGCDHARLARVIHGISLLRGREIVEIDRVPNDRTKQRKILDRAARSTLVVSIAAKMPVMDAAFASMIFTPSYHIRVIALASSSMRAREVLGENLTKTKQIALQPLARRHAAIPRLLDRTFEEREAALRVADLTPENQAALQAYDWPGNFDELRAVVERLVGLDGATSYRKAADALGVSVSTLHEWCNRLGIAIPLRAYALAPDVSNTPNHMGR